MGSQISFGCANCYKEGGLSFSTGEVKTEWTCTIGVGMMYEPGHVFFGYSEEPPMIEKLVRSKRIVNECRHHLNSGFKPEDYEHTVYCCEKCNNFFERFYFKLTKEGEVYEPDFKCSKCKRSLKRVTIDEQTDKLLLTDDDGNAIQWNCNKCDGEQLTDFFTFIHWD